MKTVTVDDYNRVRLPDVKPRQKFSYENLGNRRRLLVELDEADAPLVKARKVNGRWVGADVEFDSQAVVTSIREDRERR